MFVIRIANCDVCKEESNSIDAHPNQYSPQWAGGDKEPSRYPAQCLPRKSRQLHGPVTAPELGGVPTGKGPHHLQKDQACVTAWECKGKRSPRTGAHAMAAS